MDKVALLKKVKKLFMARICMWIIALAATIYWIYWNFHLYSMEIFDVHEFAAIFRPKFYTALTISIIAICISFLLRKFSDDIKKKIKFTVEEDTAESKK